MMSSRDLFAQKVDKSTAKGGRIDVHHHIRRPRCAQDLAAAAEAATDRGRRNTRWK